MKLAILSRNGKLYSTRRLVEAARERGHSVRVLDPLRCFMRIAVDCFAMPSCCPLDDPDAVDRRRHHRTATMPTRIGRPQVSAR